MPRIRPQALFFLSISGLFFLGGLLILIGPLYLGKGWGSPWGFVIALLWSVAFYRFGEHRPTAAEAERYRVAMTLWKVAALIIALSILAIVVNRSAAGQSNTPLQQTGGSGVVARRDAGILGAPPSGVHRHD